MKQKQKKMHGNINFEMIQKIHTLLGYLKY